MKKQIVILISLTIVCVCIIHGCTPRGSHPSPQLQTVIASWSGGQMTLSEWLHAFRELSNPEAVAAGSLGKDIEQYSHEFVAEKILWQRGKDAGLDRDPKFLDKLRPLRDQKLIDLMIRKNVDEQILPKVRELKRFYEENLDRYRSPATYSYYRIFISNEKHGEDAARKRAEECWALLDKGANFSELVEEYSDTREEKKNTLYGPFKAGELSAEIEEIILQTPLRRHSPVVKLPNGYMILFPETKTEAVQNTFESVKAKVAKEYFSQKHEMLLEEFVKQLMAKYKVTIHSDLQDKLEIQPSDTLIEIQPGPTLGSWGDFMAYTQERNANTPEERQQLLEPFSRRILLLHHARQTKFEEDEYFRVRFKPVEMRLLSDYMLELKLDPEIQVSEEEARQYYDENMEEFRRQARIEAWHIVMKIPYPLDASEKDRINVEQTTLAKLLRVRQLIAQEGHSFLTWASRITEYDDGGYLGYVPVLGMPPEWISVVATLEEGEVSHPIRVRDTLELVLRGKMEDAGVWKFEKSRDDVFKKAREKKLAQRRVEYLEELLTQVQVQYDLMPVGDMMVKILDKAGQPPFYWLDPYQ